MPRTRRHLDRAEKVDEVLAAAERHGRRPPPRACVLGVDSCRFPRVSTPGTQGPGAGDLAPGGRHAYHGGMLGTPNGHASTRLADVPAGMRRLDWVRVVVEPGRCRAEAVGVGHRVPAVVPLPLGVAADLARVGVPVVVQHARSALEPLGA